MIVATATDGAYVELTSVLLASLAQNARDDIDKVYVFGDRLTDTDKVRLRASYGLDNIEIVELSVADLTAFAGMPVSHHLSRTAYARLLMPEKITPSAQRLLYLDCDTIVNGSLAPLRDLPLDGHALAAVDDDAVRRPARHRERNRAVGLPEDMRYFNSGVLLIDTAKWREIDIAGQVGAFFTTHADRSIMDQDALNAVFRGDWLALDETWNLHRRYSSAGRDLPVEAWRQGRVIHFIGQVKPNHADCTHPARDIFLAHRQRTPWAQAPLTSRLRRKIDKRSRELRRFIARLTNRFQKEPT